MRLCFCKPQSKTEAEGGEAAAALPGCTARCSKHCSGSPACVPLKAPPYHRWAFAPSDEGSQTVLEGDGSEMSSLQQAIENAKPLSTIAIHGNFRFSEEDPLIISNSVRIRGVGAASITSHCCTVIVKAELVMLEDLEVEMSYPDPEVDPYDEQDLSDNSEGFEYTPAIQVRGAASHEHSGW
jgi:hypothetical protein